MIGLLCSWIPSSCIWPHKTGTRSSQSAFLHGGLGAHNHLLTAIDSWWFLGEEKSAFFKDVALAGQAHGQHELSLWVRKQEDTKLGGGVEAQSCPSCSHCPLTVSVCLLSCLSAVSGFSWIFFLNEVYDTQVYFSIKFFIVFLFLNINWFLKPIQLCYCEACRQAADSQSLTPMATEGRGPVSTFKDPGTRLCPC